MKNKPKHIPSPEEMRSPAASIARTTFTVKLWPHRDPEGEEGLAGIRFVCVKMLLPVPAGSSASTKLALGTQIARILPICFLQMLFLYKPPFVSELQWPILLYCQICT